MRVQDVSRSKYELEPKLQDIYAIRAVSLSMEKTGVEGISKYTIKLCSPTQDTRTTYLAPVYISIEF